MIAVGYAVILLCLWVSEKKRRKFSAGQALTGLFGLGYAAGFAAKLVLGQYAWLLLYGWGAVMAGIALAAAKGKRNSVE